MLVRFLRPLVGLAALVCCYGPSGTSICFVLTLAGLRVDTGRRLG